MAGTVFRLAPYDNRALPEAVLKSSTQDQGVELRTKYFPPNQVGFMEMVGATTRFEIAGKRLQFLSATRLLHIRERPETASGDRKQWSVSVNEVVLSLGISQGHRISAMIGYEIETEPLKRLPVVIAVFPEADTKIGDLNGDGRCDDFLVKVKWFKFSDDPAAKPVETIEYLILDRVMSVNPNAKSI